MAKLKEVKEDESIHLSVSFKLKPLHLRDIYNS